MPNKNDFDYSADPAGDKCPLHSHARLANSRRPEDQKRRIARRGITYGVRPDLHQLGALFGPPSVGVGLLFMSYQADIEAQFEYLQAELFGGRRSGHRDLLAPRVDDRLAEYSWPSAYASRNRHVAPFAATIKLMGGEYYYSPSLTFLRQLV